MAVRRAWTPRKAEHAHDDLELIFLNSGSMRVVLGRNCLDLPARRWVLYWAAIPHYAYGERLDFTWLTVPLGEALRWGVQLAGPLSGDLLLAPEEDPFAPALIGRWAEERLGEAARLEVQALVRRLLGSARPVLGGQHTVPERAAALLAERSAAAQACSVPALAADLGVHPKYLMRAFRQATGLTLHGFLRSLRVAHAQRLLLDGELSVQAIADRVGFGAPSRLYEAFQAQTGCSPAAWRTAARPR
jgi:AraC-like DNA-binding protein